MYHAGLGALQVDPANAPIGWMSQRLAGTPVGTQKFSLPDVSNVQDGGQDQEDWSSLKNEGRQDALVGIGFSLVSAMVSGGLAGLAVTGNAKVAQRTGLALAGMRSFGMGLLTMMGSKMISRYSPAAAIEGYSWSIGLAVLGTLLFSTAVWWMA